MGAKSADAYIAGAEAWTESDCTGEIPIVVGSDAKAQSDIYSAITLAGAIESDCVILAGARGGDMAAAQRARLDTADSEGYVVGGEAAVPTAKFSKPGRQLQRIGGSDRWATAQQVGAIAAGSDVTKIAKPPSKSGSVEVQSAGAHISGAEGWFSTDCTTQIPIIVGSDAAAQSDIYSAISLAGVVGANCVILAGPRNGDMPAAQKERLDAANSGGYVVGGEAAVPAAKITGRTMIRIGGSDRWATAQLVGAIAAGSDPAKLPDPPSKSGSIKPAISAGSAHTCALRSNGNIACWGHNYSGQTNVPDGSYTAIALENRYTCALRTNGRIACWGANSSGRNNVPDGSYTAIALGNAHACALRTNGNIACWGESSFGPSDVRDGSYTAIALGYRHTCALRTNGNIACWGHNYSGQTDVPDGSYTAIALRNDYACALRTNGNIACWGDNRHGQTDVPDGSYTAIALGNAHACALRTNGNIACWGHNYSGQTDVPDGSYTAIALRNDYACALRTNGNIACWGDNRHGQTDVPDGSYTAIALGYYHACALRTNGNIACWGRNSSGQTNVP